MGVEPVSAEYNRVFNVNWKLFIGLVRQKTRVDVKWITEFPKEVVLYKKSPIAVDERAININFLILRLTYVKKQVNLINKFKTFLSNQFIWNIAEFSI